MSPAPAPLLQSFASYDRRAELYADGIVELPASARANEPTVGHYEVVAGVLWILYRVAERVTLRIEKAAFSIDGSLALSLVGAGSGRRLEIARAGARVAAFAAPVLEDPLLEATLESTAFAEAEDFDFALFVVHVAADPDRRARIYA